jgi:hypothetical protein
MDLSRRAGSRIIGSTPESTGTTDSLAQFAKEEVLASNRQENEVRKLTQAKKQVLAKECIVVFRSLWECFWKL